MGLSFLFGLNTIGYKCVEKELREVVHPNPKVSVIPWALAPHDGKAHAIDDYFSRNSIRYEREINYLRDFGIRDENVAILDFYGQSSTEICEEISSSDIVILCGGDTELLVDKLMYTEAVKALADFKGTIIGGSAGATAQFDQYFITPEQSFYNVLQECVGIGIIKSDFLIDVHTNQYTMEKSDAEREKYLKVLKDLRNKYCRKIYGICDDGAIIFDRTNLSYSLYGNVLEI